jgi:hypothetical protein
MRNLLIWMIFCLIFSPFFLLLIWFLSKRRKKLLILSFFWPFFIFLFFLLITLKQLICETSGVGVLIWGFFTMISFLVFMIYVVLFALLKFFIFKGKKKRRGYGL